MLDRLGRDPDALGRAIAFLESRGAIASADLMSCCLGSDDGSGGEAWCLRHDAVRGILWLRRTPDSQRFSYVARLDAIDEQGVVELLAGVPCRAEGYFRVHSSPAQELFQSRWRSALQHTDLLYSVTHASFVPARNHHDIREVTPSDLGLFRNYQGWAEGEVAREGIRVFAVISEGTVASSAWLGYAVPQAPARCPLVGIAGVFTEPASRGRGLATALVSHMTRCILDQGEVPSYWTTPDNTASQRVARALGYAEYGTIKDYLVSPTG